MDTIIGHDKIREGLLNSIKNGNVSHAHMIIGEDGIGKGCIAHEVAINILGKEKYKDYVDIKEYDVQNNKKSISVEQVRKIIEETTKKPYEGDKKVVILHRADKMTSQAQNAFLKTIEEPPGGVYIILLCENGESVLDTIKSRCQIHKLRRLNEKEIDEFFQFKYPNISEEELKAAKAFCDGIPGMAEKLINDNTFKNIRESIIKIMVDLYSTDVVKFLENEDILMKYKDVWQDLLSCFLSYLRDIMVYKETGQEELMINLDKVKFIKDFSAIFSYKKLSIFIDVINNARNNLSSNVNPAMVFHVMLLNLHQA